MGKTSTVQWQGIYSAGKRWQVIPLLASQQLPSQSKPGSKFIPQWHKADLRERAKVVKVVRLLKNKRKTNKYPVEKENKKKSQQSLDTLLTCTTPILMLLLMLWISPQGHCFHCISKTSSRPRVWHLHAYFPPWNPSLYMVGMTTEHLMQLSAQQHFNTGKINPVACTSITLWTRV